MKDSPTSPESSTYTLSGTSTLILSTPPIAKCPSYHLYGTRTSGASISSTKTIPVVVSIIIVNFMVSRVLIDQDNFPNILYWKTFQRLEVSLDIVHPYASPLLDFIGERVETRGYVDLMTTFGQGKLSRSFTIRYLLVDATTSYFALIGRKTLKELGAISSMPHLTTKFPTLTWEIVIVKADQK